MPGFNGTGPRGQGPGRGWGRCFRGRGWGQPPLMGLGGPPRWGYGPWGFGISVSSRKTGYASTQDEAAALRDYAAFLQGELAAIQRRLAAMEDS